MLPTPPCSFLLHSYYEAMRRGVEACLTRNTSNGSETVTLSLSSSPPISARIQPLPSRPRPRPRPLMSIRFDYYFVSFMRRAAQRRPKLSAVVSSIPVSSATPTPSTPASELSIAVEVPPSDATPSLIIPSQSANPIPGNLVSTPIVSPSSQPPPVFVCPHCNLHYGFPTQTCMTAHVAACHQSPPGVTPTLMPPSVTAASPPSVWHTPLRSKCLWGRALASSVRFTK